MITRVPFSQMLQHLKSHSLSEKAIFEAALSLKLQELKKNHQKWENFPKYV